MIPEQSLCWSIVFPARWTRAGRAYAANILGCILGPLFAGFILIALAGRARLVERADIALVCHGIAHDPDLRRSDSVPDVVPRGTSGYRFPT
jgi:hypothetical protein